MTSPSEEGIPVVPPFPLLPPAPPDPLDPSLIKAGETLMLHALESRREICKLMLTTTAASLGAYLALLGLVLKKESIAAYFAASWKLAATPVLLFLLAAVCFVGGYFHHDHAGAPEIVGWLENRQADELRQGMLKTLVRRKWFLSVGNGAFWIAILFGLAAAYHAIVI